MLHTVFENSPKKAHIAGITTFYTTNDPYLCGRESKGGETVRVRRTKNLPKNLCKTCYYHAVINPK